MGTDAISPLRQRMIEDMSARKLNPQKLIPASTRIWHAVGIASTYTLWRDQGLLMAPEATRRNLNSSGPREAFRFPHQCQ
jgi:hypothetical protein